MNSLNSINITGFQSASVYIPVPTILPQNKILVIFFAFWRLYLSSAGMFGFINSIQCSLPIDQLLHRSTWTRLTEDCGFFAECNTIASEISSLRKIILHVDCT